MGNYQSVNKITDSSLEKFLVEREICPNIIIGYNKDGAKIFYNNQYYKLVDSNKYISRIEFFFENNIKLVIEKMREVTTYGTAKLFYKLTQGRDVIMGELNVPYQKMNIDGLDFDLIDQLQKID